MGRSEEARARPAGGYLRTQLTQLRDQGVHRVRVGWLPIVQSSLGAGLAWLIAFDALNHPRPFFAPISAVLSLGVSFGQRLSRTVELLSGVILGVFVGSALQEVVGSGAIQLVLFVGVAMIVALLFSGSPMTASQAAVSAVLLATLTPTQDLANAGFLRCSDALIGAVVGVSINAVLLPVNPLTIIRRAARPIFAELATVLEDVAAALRADDEAGAIAALTRARALDKRLAVFDEEVQAAAELARVAPLRWSMRSIVQRYGMTLTFLDYTVRNTRVLARRGFVLVEERERVPPELPDALDHLAAAVRQLRVELAGDPSFTVSRERIARAVKLAHGGLADPGATVSAEVAFEQVRSTALDLLRATGLTRAEALEAIGGPPSPPMSSVSE